MQVFEVWMPAGRDWTGWRFSFGTRAAPGRTTFTNAGCAWGNLPRDLWHTVRMTQAALIPASETASTQEATAPRFNFDWRQVEQGLPLATLEEFATYSGFAMKDLLEVVIPLRTLKHRRQRQEVLNPEESDKLARVARLWELAVKVFGNPDKARRWLTKPKVRFDEKTPLQMMHTGAGGDGVEEMLGQIDEGYFA